MEPVLGVTKGQMMRLALKWVRLPGRKRWLAPWRTTLQDLNRVHLLAIANLPTKTCARRKLRTDVLLNRVTKSTVFRTVVTSYGQLEPSQHRCPTYGVHDNLHTLIALEHSDRLSKFRRDGIVSILVARSLAAWWPHPTELAICILGFRRFWPGYIMIEDYFFQTQNKAFKLINDAFFLKKLESYSLTRRHDVLGSAVFSLACPFVAVIAQALQPN